jgi:hypothetical protein
MALKLLNNFGCPVEVSILLGRLRLALALPKPLAKAHAPVSGLKKSQRYFSP